MDQMVTDALQNKNNSNSMNISMAFKELVSVNPPRYTELCETVNKTFEEINDNISLEEFKNILGDISFLRSKRNVANLFSTLKTQFNNYSNVNFKQIVEDENLSELFTKKNILNDEDANKYIIDDDSLELIELEESLKKLDLQIAELENTNEYHFDQEKFNKQRLNELSERVTKLIDESEIKYNLCVNDTEIIRKEFDKM